MRRKRIKKDKIEEQISEVTPLNEGVYDFYETQSDYPDESTTDKILNYYIDKIRKHGQDSLTDQEFQIFNDAKKGELSLEKPMYKRNKVTNEIEYDNLGNPIRLDKDILIPGVPFLTSKGRGEKKKEQPKGACWWNVDEDFKTWYVFTPDGLTIWKSFSPMKEFGSFIVPKNEAGLVPVELWKALGKRFDTGIYLTKEMFQKFCEFDRLYHDGKKANKEKLEELYEVLKNYPSK